MFHCRCAPRGYGIALLSSRITVWEQHDLLHLPRILGLDLYWAYPSERIITADEGFLNRSSTVLEIAIGATLCIVALFSRHIFCLHKQFVRSFVRSFVFFVFLRRIGKNKA